MPVELNKILKSWGSDLQFCNLKKKKQDLFTLQNCRSDPWDYEINISAFARKIGVSRGTLTRILAGKPLTLEVAIKIERGTEEKATCQELLGSNHE